MTSDESQRLKESYLWLLGFDPDHPERSTAEIDALQRSFYGKDAPSHDPRSVPLRAIRRFIWRRIRSAA